MIVKSVGKRFTVFEFNVLISLIYDGDGEYWVIQSLDHKDDVLFPISKFVNEGIMDVAELFIATLARDWTFFCTGSVNHNISSVYR